MRCCPVLEELFIALDVYLCPHFQRPTNESRHGASRIQAADRRNEGRRAMTNTQPKALNLRSVRTASPRQPFPFSPSHVLLAAFSPHICTASLGLLRLREIHPSFFSIRQLLQAGYPLFHSRYAFRHSAQSRMHFLPFLRLDSPIHCLTKKTATCLAQGGLHLSSGTSAVLTKKC